MITRYLFALLMLFCYGNSSAQYSTSTDSQDKIGQPQIYLIDKLGKKCMPDSVESYIELELLTNSSYGTRYLKGVLPQGGGIIIDSLGNGVFSLEKGESIIFYHSNMLFATRNKRYKLGFINSAREVFVPYGKYQDYRYNMKFNDFCMVSTKNPKVQWGAISLETGKEIVPLIYDRIIDYSNNCAIVLLDEKSGLVSKTGEEILAPIYDDIQFRFAFGKYLVCVADEKYYIVNVLTAEIVAQVNHVSYERGLVAVEKKNGYALFDTNMKSVSSHTYTKVAMSSNGLRASRDGLNYYINNNGEEILSNTGIIQIFGGKIYFEQPYGFDFYDYEGNKIGEERFKVPNTITRNPVRNERGKLGFEDESGKLVIPYQYDFCKGIQDDRIIIGNSDKGGVVDMNNNVIFPIEYDGVEFTYNGNIGLRKGSKIHFTDKDGNPLSEYTYEQFDEVRSSISHWEVFKCNYGAKRNGKWTILDGDAQELTPLYDSIGTAYKHNFDTYLMVSNNHKWGLWNLTSNQEYLACEFEDIFMQSDFSGKKPYPNIIHLKHNGKWAMYNLITKEPLTDFIFDDRLSHYYETDYKFYVGSINEHRGIVDETGKIIIPFKNKSIKKFYDLFVVQSTCNE